MTEHNNDEARFKLTQKQHENEFKRYSVTEDLAAKLDRLHDQLQEMEVKLTVNQNTYKPYLKDF